MTRLGFDREILGDDYHAFENSLSKGGWCGLASRQLRFVFGVLPSIGNSSKSAPRSRRWRGVNLPMRD
jgi:hypothetical protein